MTFDWIFCPVPYNQISPSCILLCFQMIAGWHSQLYWWKLSRNLIEMWRKTLFLVLMILSTNKMEAKVQTLWHLLLETKCIQKKTLYKKWRARDLVFLEPDRVLWELSKLDYVLFALFPKNTLRLWEHSIIVRSTI